MVDSFVIKSSNNPKLVVIFLHGLGDNGAGWKEAFSEIKHPDIHYVFPNAPGIPVSLNFGMVMPAWFDIKALDFTGPEDKVGIQKSAENARACIKQQMQKFNLPSNKIVIGGFSQGGAVALYTALTHEEQLGGVLALSTWLPLHQLFKNKLEGHSLSKQACEVQQFHGLADGMVKFKYGQMTNDLLKSAGVNASIKSYAGLEHSSSTEEMRDVKVFLNKVLSSN